jgi:anti-anti-sigma factor
MTSELAVQPIHDLEFSAEANTTGAVFTVKLTGNADLNVKLQLDRFVATVHENAGKVAAEEVVVDLRRLEFMNSSCLKSFVWWISMVQDMGPGVSYKITFLSSPSMYWQRRSLNALACLATDLVSVQV